MNYVKITVDGVTYNLIQRANGEWTITNKAPLTAGEYLLTVTITTEAGREVVIDSDDQDLIEALTLIVKGKESVFGERMLSYYPQVIQEIIEFQAVLKGEGLEFDFLNTEKNLVLDDAYLLTMGEERTSQWEQALGIRPLENSSLSDRRDTIVARIRGQGKLNTALINAIVGAFTGGTAKSYVENSTLYVKISPPPDNKQYQFANVEQELKNKVPAHIRLVVTRNYATWNEIKNNYTSWETINALDNWEELKLWVAPS